VDSNSPCEGLLFLRGRYLVQKPLYLVGTVLKVVKQWFMDHTVGELHIIGALVIKDVCLKIF